ncbi:hypothetical protein LCGC14_1772190 [marine sediment metagenome]|uniref:DUF559 domain-containing protein n=1 Tax=marine sediment metagenome TaxID=412755 RepID=A0A0F9JXL5_9ZZZZ
MKKNKLTEQQKAILEADKGRPRGKKASKSITILPQHGKRRNPRVSDKVFLKKKAAQMRKRPTGAEAVFGRKLQEANIRFKSQYPYNHRGLKGIFDFYLFDYNMMVEIDGGYHLEPSQQQTDAIKDFVCEKYLKKQMVRFTNNQALYLSIEQILVIIENLFITSKTMAST